MQTTNATVERGSGAPIISNDPTQNMAGNKAAAGNLPNTEVIADALHTTEVAFHETSVRPPPELNSQGRRLLTDLENLTSTQRRFLEEKNPDNLMQLIMQEGRLAARDMQNQLKSGQFQGLDKATQQRMASQANSVLSDVQGLAMELISSQNFRNELLNLLSVLAEITQEITGTDLSKLTESLQSLPDDLQEAKDQGQILDTAKSKIAEVASAAREVARDAKNTSTNQPLTDEHVETILDHLRRTVREIAKRERTKNVIQGMMDLMNMFTGHYAMQSNKEQAKNIVMENEHLDNLAGYVKLLIQRFAGEQEVNDLLTQFRTLMEIATKHDDVRQYFIDLRNFIQNALQNADTYLVKNGPGDKELRRLIEQGRILFKEKELKEHFVGILNNLNAVITNFMNDPHLNQLQADIKHFINDLVTDDNGNIVITKNALNQLKVILVSSLLEKMAIPIPMINHEDEKMEFEVSNLWLVLRDVIPDMVHLEYREAFNLDTSDLRGKGVGVQEENQIIVHAMNMKFSMKDANIWWKRKKFPKSEDSGNLDMVMPGDGIELRVVLTLRLKDPQNQIFAVRSVDCDIDKINVRLSNTKHDKIYNAFLKVTKGAIKKRIETAIEEKITDMIGLLNGQISRQIVAAASSGQKKVFGGIAKQIENVTGVALQPSASAARDQNFVLNSGVNNTQTTSTVMGTSNNEVIRESNIVREVAAPSTITTTAPVTTTTGVRTGVLSETEATRMGDPGYVKETVTITTPDGHSTTTVKEKSYTGSV